MSTIDWAAAVNGIFTEGANWTDGVAPSTSDDAILDAADGAPYKVTMGVSQGEGVAVSVNSIQTAENATLLVNGTSTFWATTQFSATGGTDAIVNAGTISIPNGGELRVGEYQGGGDTVENTGLIAFSGANDSTFVFGDNTTLTGGGVIAMNGRNSSQGVDTLAALYMDTTVTNVDDTITGAGKVGNSQMALINESAGVIDAVGVGTMIVSTGGSALSNSGLMEATATGTLAITNSTVDNAGGVIAAAAGGVWLQSADIVGGTLQSSGVGAIHALSDADILDGTASAIANEGRVVIGDTATLTVQGAIDNTGLIVLSGFDSNGATLAIGAVEATLSGDGLVTLNNDADNAIGGAAGTTLVNAGKIAGAGDIGDGTLALVNQTGAVINGDDARALTIDTGANTIVNAGEIAGGGAGGTTIATAIDNAGTLFAAKGNLTVEGAVTGLGAAFVNRATLDFGSTFTQNVTFTDGSGVLELADSEGYASTIHGFSKTGGTSLDLVDIPYVSGTTAATFVGTATGGVLTVSEGGAVANINLAGDYLASGWTLSSDGHGGTTVVDPATGGPKRAAHVFVEAMARTGAGAAAAEPRGDAWRSAPPMLASSRAEAA